MQKRAVILYSTQSPTSFQGLPIIRITICNTVTLFSTYDRSMVQNPVQTSKTLQSPPPILVLLRLDGQATAPQDIRQGGRQIGRLSIQDRTVLCRSL